MFKIAIVGAGASGVLTAIHILRAFKDSPPVEITIYEPSSEIGAGLAYGTKSPEHILNVPADKMSCDEREPLDFVDWLKKNQPAVFSDRHYPFVSRRFFKEYLQARLKESHGKHLWRWFAEKADHIFLDAGKKWAVTSNQTEVQHYDVCIVATGYNPSYSVPRGLSGKNKIAVTHPYREISGVETWTDVAIIGTGLTAIDIWRTLRRKGFRGTVSFLSRRGLFPQAFTFHRDFSGDFEIAAHASPRSLLRRWREVQREQNCDAGGIAMHLRSSASAIWKSWSLKQKKQFLNHLQPYWDTVRHRLPDTVYGELQDELQTGRASVSKARGLNAETVDGRIRLSFSNGRSVAVDKVFIATGARLDVQSLHEELPSATACPLGLGFESRDKNLFFVGPITRTTHWEISAVPEIRLQAQRIAETIAQKIEPSRP